MEKVADFLYDLAKDHSLVFDAAHYVLCILGERADMGDGFLDEARKHPLGCWLSSMMTCFAGGLLVSLVCGEAVLPALLADPLRLFLATMLWYGFFFGPKDWPFKVAEKAYVKLPLCAIKGLHYPVKIVSGLKHSRHLFRRSVLPAVAVAVLKSNGSGIIKPLARLARGKWTPAQSESMMPSTTTKMCLLGALIYNSFPYDVTYIGLVGLFVAMKSCPAAGIPFDPFTKVEDALAPIVLGGDEDKTKKE